MKVYPLLLEPMFFEKVWGGRRLEGVGKRIPAGKLIGESWELADLGGTSPSGGGGAPARSRIANGALAGKTIADAVRAWGPALMGSARLSREGGFPLLVKFLDARENLSVQVHPSPEYAAARGGGGRAGGVALKTECWYILAAEPASVIYKGLRPGVGREELARRIAEGTVVEVLERVPAVPGEMHGLPSGTVHALGAGVLVAEVQTPSDTTFRVYDWGRKGRDLHIAEALECIAPGPAPAARRRSKEAKLAELERNEFFSVSEWEGSAGEKLELEGGTPVVLVVVGGRVGVEGAGERVEAGVGATVLVPAAAAGMVQAGAVGEGGRVLVVKMADSQ